MVKSMMINILRYQAIERGRFVGAWRRFGQPSLGDWTEYLKRHRSFQSFGDFNAINPNTFFDNPSLISLGSNVRIAGASLYTHDGSVNMINRAFNLSLDNVGPIRISDNVFIGVSAIIMPNVRIGKNVIVAAGSVVTRDVEPDSIVAGVPAAKVTTLDRYVEKLVERNKHFPWASLIAKRGAEYDPKLEPELRRLRVEHFFGSDPLP